MDQMTVARLAREVIGRQQLARASGKTRFLLGIAGPPAAGKSTLAGLLCEECDQCMGEGYCATVPMDGFHLRNNELDKMGWRARKGAPHTFDVAGFANKLRELRCGFGHEVVCPTFDRSGTEEPTEEGMVVPGSARLIVTEGSYLLLSEPPWNAVRPLLDEVWYVDVAREAVRERSLARHQVTGNDEATARQRVETTDLPNYDTVSATKPLADYVIPASNGSTK